MEELIIEWEKRLLKLDELANKYKNDHHNIRKFVYIAKGTRDCLEELKLQLLQTDVVGRSEQLTYKCDYCQDDGVMITGLDCTCDAAPNKS